MTDPEIYPITGDWTNASLNAKTYAELYEAAASNPGGFWLDHLPGLRVIAYGFSWKRLTGLDNLTWWLFEKRC